MRLRSLLTLLALLAVAAACESISDGDRVSGSGSVVAESRDLDDYTAIDLRGEGRVEFAAGPDAVIEIETDTNLLEYIETEVVRDELIIRTRSGTDIDPTDTVVYRLGCPVLERITLTGAGDIDASECASADRLDVTLRGAGTIAARGIDAESVDAVLPGAGTIRLVGRAATGTFSPPGAGSLDAGELESVDAEASSSGAGSLEVWVTGTLDAEVSGVGGIRYRGNPEVAANVTGVGSIEPIG